MNEIIASSFEVVFGGNFKSQELSISAIRAAVIQAELLFTIPACRFYHATIYEKFLPALRIDLVKLRRRKRFPLANHNQGYEFTEMAIVTQGDLW